MQYSQQFFRIEPAVGDNSNNRGHDERRNTQGSKQRSDFVAHTAAMHIDSERNQPRSPNKKLEELQYRKAEFQVHAINVYKRLKNFPKIRKICIRLKKHRDFIYL
jgi:hypothetical protein